jgi:hypothetical protein
MTFLHSTLQYLADIIRGLHFITITLFYDNFFQSLYFSFIPTSFRHIWIPRKFNRQSEELTLRGRCCYSLPTPRRPLEFRPLPSRCSSLTISKLNTINSEARARSYILKPLPVNQTFYPSNWSIFTDSTEWPFDSSNFLEYAIRFSTSKNFSIFST